MAAWAIQQDITDRYGLSFLDWIADRNHDGAIESVPITLALDDATEEARSYVGQKYDLDDEGNLVSVETLPALLVKVVVDIAAFNLAGFDAGAMSDEHRSRHKSAIDWLTKLSKGIVSLGIADPPATVGATKQLDSLVRTRRSTQTEGLI